MKIKNVEKDVREILENNEQARADDDKLYGDYVYSKLEKAGADINGEWLLRVMTDIRFKSAYDIASYGTVSRTRRRLQAKYRNLRPSEEVVKARRELIKEYRKYAREGGRYEGI